MEIIQSDIYTVQKLLKHRKRSGRVEYLVKWLNWPSRFNSWEPESNILDSRLIDDYKAKLLCTSIKKPKRGRKPLGIDQKITKKYRKTNGYAPPLRFPSPQFQTHSDGSNDIDRPKIRLTIPRERILEPNSSTSTESSYCEEETNIPNERKESIERPSSSSNEAKENDIMYDSYFVSSEPEILRKHDPHTCDCANPMPRLLKIKTPKTPVKISGYESPFKEDSQSLDSSPLENDLEINNNDLLHGKKKKKKKKKKSHRQRSPERTKSDKFNHKPRNSNKFHHHSPHQSPITLPHSLTSAALPTLETTRLIASQRVTVTDVTVNNVTLTVKECVKSPSDFFTKTLLPSSSSPLACRTKSVDSLSPIISPVVVNQANELHCPSPPLTVSTSITKTSTASSSIFSVDNLLNKTSDKRDLNFLSKPAIVVSTDCNYHSPLNAINTTPKKSLHLNGESNLSMLNFNSHYNDPPFSHPIDVTHPDDNSMQDKPIDLSARKC